MSEKIWRVTVMANGQTVHTVYVDKPEDLDEAEREAARLKWQNLAGCPVNGEVTVTEGVVSWYNPLKSKHQPERVEEHHHTTDFHP